MQQPHFSVFYAKNHTSGPAIKADSNFKKTISKRTAYGHSDRPPQLGQMDGVSYLLPFSERKFTKPFFYRLWTGVAGAIKTSADDLLLHKRSVPILVYPVKSGQATGKQSGAIFTRRATHNPALDMSGERA
jgi:hypothetical protein